MVTILQDMVKKGLIAQANGKWTLRLALEDVGPTVPETLDQMIEMHSSSSVLLEQCILRSASVAGERFSVWAISTSAEFESGSIDDACEGVAGTELPDKVNAGNHSARKSDRSPTVEFRELINLQLFGESLTSIVDASTFEFGRGANRPYGETLSGNTGASQNALLQRTELLELHLDHLIQRLWDSRGQHLQAPA